jgi:hypothetical protein
VEPPAQPPIIWSDDEENADEGEQVNSVTEPEPRTFRQAIHGHQSNYWRDAATQPATLRIIMALSAVEDLELRSVDITAAFINGDLDEKIYMK